MEEVIDRILEGNFEYENGSLEFSCTKLELTIKKGEVREGSFRILGENGRYTKGTVSSTDRRMECLTKEFVGTEETVGFCFHGENLEEGDVVKGEFCVVSNQGEYYLPFVVSVEYVQLTSSLGNIKNLFHFANLAKTNQEEAAALFYAPDFKNIFTGSDRQYADRYRALSADYGNEQNIEEFLISINKKQKIEYLTDTEELRFDNPEGVVAGEITITRNGWGYTRLHVEVQGDFLYTEKTELCDDDFLGNVCRLPVFVEESALHEGNHFGRVRIFNRYAELEIPVFVKYHGAGWDGRRRWEKKQLIREITELYQAFRLKKTDTASWLEGSRRIVEEMTGADEKDIAARLFQTQLLITEGRCNEAQWILDHVSDMLQEAETEDPVLKAYYLYLTTLIQRNEEYVNRIAGEVEQIYKKNRDEWRIAWLLLYLSEEYSRSSAKRWLFLEEQADRGCISPVIYIEALLLLNRNPSLLMKLGRFEKNVLSYGAKQELLSRDVILQFVYLVQKEREYSPGMYRILKQCYRLMPAAEVLREICSLLIKGNKTGTEYHEWYRLGVEKEIRITRLYEYYMLSVDREKVDVLPKMVLMYFSYQNTLHYELAAFLYVNVYRNRENFPDLYENYRHTIEQFVTEQIIKRHINRDLAYLYKNVLSARMVTKEVAEALAELLFVHRIQIAQKDIRYVIVYQDYRREEQKYPVTDRKAYVSLPTGEATIVFEDAYKNRYVTGVQHIIEKLLLPGKLAKLIMPMVENGRDFFLYQCFNGREMAEITAENEKGFRYLAEDTDMVNACRQMICMRLLQYYYEKDKIRELDTYLAVIDPGFLSAAERSEVMRYLLMRGQEERAKAWLGQYGPYGMEPKALVRLCSFIIKEKECTEDEMLTEAVWYAFSKGKYDERCLGYLVKYYKGLTGKLRDIWKAAVDFGMEVRSLEERILVQMLYSGAYVGEKTDIFRKYVADGAETGIELAFLSQCAYEYYVKDRLAAGCLFEEMAALYRHGEALQKVCKLSYIKYYAENKAELTAERKNLVKQFIKEMLRENIRLKMFWEFADEEDTELSERLSDRTVVEYKAHPQARAVMHYCVEMAEGEEAAYCTEDMNEAYGGVCYKDFVLFFGERLQYYIMEKREGSEQLTESASIQKSDAGLRGAESKYSLINDLSISSALQDYETVDKLLEEYAYKEFLKNGLFKLM